MTEMNAEVTVAVKEKTPEEQHEQPIKVDEVSKLPSDELQPITAQQQNNIPTKLTPLHGVIKPSIS